MTLTSPLTAPEATSAPTRVLEAVNGIIAELAGDRPLTTSLAAPLEALRAMLSAEEAAIWLPSATGMVRAWGNREGKVGA